MNTKKIKNYITKKIGLSLILATALTGYGFADEDTFTFDSLDEQNIFGTLDISGDEDTDAGFTFETKSIDLNDGSEISNKTETTNALDAVKNYVVATVTAQGNIRVAQLSTDENIVLAFGGVDPSDVVHNGQYILIDKNAEEVTENIESSEKVVELLSKNSETDLIPLLFANSSGITYHSAIEQAKALASENPDTPVLLVYMAQDVLKFEEDSEDGNISNLTLQYGTDFWNEKNEEFKTKWTDVRIALDEAGFFYNAISNSWSSHLVGEADNAMPSGTTTGLLVHKAISPAHGLFNDAFSSWYHYLETTTHQVVIEIGIDDPLKIVGGAIERLVACFSESDLIQPEGEGWKVADRRENISWNLRQAEHQLLSFKESGALKLDDDNPNVLDPDILQDCNNETEAPLLSFGSTIIAQSTQNQTLQNTVSGKIQSSQQQNPGSTGLNNGTNTIGGGTSDLSQLDIQFDHTTGDVTIGVKDSLGSSLFTSTGTDLGVHKISDTNLFGGSETFTWGKVNDLRPEFGKALSAEELGFSSSVSFGKMEDLGADSLDTKVTSINIANSVKSTSTNANSVGSITTTDIKDIDTTSFWDNVKDTIDSAGDYIIDVISDIGDDISDVIDYVWDGGLVNDISDFGNYIWDNLSGFGNYIWDGGLVNDISDAFSSIGSFFGGWF